MPPSLRGVPWDGSPASTVLWSTLTSCSPRLTRLRSARRFHLAVETAGSPRFLRSPCVRALASDPGGSSRKALRVGATSIALSLVPPCSYSQRWASRVRGSAWPNKRSRSSSSAPSGSQDVNALAGLGLQLIVTLIKVPLRLDDPPASQHVGPCCSFITRRRRRFMTQP